MWPNRCLRHVEYHYTNITGKSFFGFLDVIVSYNSTFSGDCAYNCIIFHASGEAKGQPDPSLVVSVIHRGRQNEDTLWRQLCWRDHVSKCWLVLPRAQHLCPTQILCPGHKKCFWKSSETFPVSGLRATMLRTGNVAGHNVAATMCPRFARALIWEI